MSSAKFVLSLTSASAPQLEGSSSGFDIAVGGGNGVHAGTLPRLNVAQVVADVNGFMRRAVRGPGSCGKAIQDGVCDLSHRPGRPDWAGREINACH